MSNSYVIKKLQELNEKLDSMSKEEIIKFMKETTIDPDVYDVMSISYHSKSSNKKRSLHSFSRIFERNMKYLLVLFLGVIIGIGGELLIPTKYESIWGGGCIKRTKDDLVFMPQLLIYDPKEKEFPYPNPYGGGPMTFVPSYLYLYYMFVTKELTYLSKDECNGLIEKYIDRDKK